MPADKLDEVPPRDTFQVLDADSSQQVAILAAKSGASMVIEGPPGTGKSQTITNIIAECLSQGKTVLFVAEKAAALEVVKRRLDAVQLGDFVLELHSRKASKRQIIEELGRVMNASYPPAERFDLDARDLEQLRARLNSYVRMLHEPRTALEKSLFEAMSDFAALRTAPVAPVDMSKLVSASRDEFARMQELVSLLSRAASGLGDLAAHPWRGVGLSEISLDERQKLPAKVEEMKRVVQEIQSSSTAACGLLAAPAPVCRQDAQQLLDLAKVVLQTKSITPKSFEGPPWPNPTDKVDELVELGRAIQQTRAQISRALEARCGESGLAGSLRAPKGPSDDEVALVSAAVLSRQQPDPAVLELSAASAAERRRRLAAVGCTGPAEAAVRGADAAGRKSFRRDVARLRQRLAGSRGSCRCHAANFAVADRRADQRRGARQGLHARWKNATEGGRATVCRRVQRAAERVQGVRPAAWA